MNDVLIVGDKATALVRTLQRSAMARGGYRFDALELKWSAEIADELGEALKLPKEVIDRYVVTKWNARQACKMPTRLSRASGSR